MAQAGKPAAEMDKGRPSNAKQAYLEEVKKLSSYSEKVDGILKDMLQELFAAKPEDPVKACHFIDQLCFLQPEAADVEADALINAGAVTLTLLSLLLSLLRSS